MYSNYFESASNKLFYFAYFGLRSAALARRNEKNSCKTMVRPSTSSGLGAVLMAPIFSATQKFSSSRAVEGRTLLMQRCVGY
jgi:hypothetical protein